MTFKVCLNKYYPFLMLSVCLKKKNCPYYDYRVFACTMIENNYYCLNYKIKTFTE